MVQILAGGYCTQFERMTLPDGKWRNVKFPALFALFEHESGPVLFDTGYATRYYDETARFPAKLYRWLIPVYVHDNDAAVSQLRARGIEPEDVRTVIVSHFHADHIGGLKDFPNARFVCFREAWEDVKTLWGWRAIQKAFLPGLVPEDFEARADFIEATETLPAEYAPFERGADIFGDGRAIAVDLPGHAAGQMGLVVDGVFLVADACWSSRAYRELLLPHPVARLLVGDAALDETTLRKLNALHKHHPDLPMLPSHCNEVYAQYV